MRVLLVGIGQSLRGDDSAGLEAVRLWQRDHFSQADHSDVQVELIESPGPELAGALAGASAVVLVDAVRSGAKAGTIRRLTEGEIATAEIASGTMHGWGVPEALRLATSLGRVRGRQDLRLVGIEAEQMEIGAPLSPAVSGAMPAAAAAIDIEIRNLLRM